MTNYEQGFLTKCAEHGVPEQTAVALLKMAYELGSVSPIVSEPEEGHGFRDSRASFASTDPIAVGYPGDSAEAISMVQPGSLFSDRTFLNLHNFDPMSVDEQKAAYRAAMSGPYAPADGLIRRVPITESGQYNSTTWKDNNDLAALQTDAIRRRRGVGTPLVFDPVSKRYRYPTE